MRACSISPSMWACSLMDSSASTTLGTCDIKRRLMLRSITQKAFVDRPRWTCGSKLAKRSRGSPVIVYLWLFEVSRHRGQPGHVTVLVVLRAHTQSVAGRERSIVGEGLELPYRLPKTRHLDPPARPRRAELTGRWRGVRFSLRLGAAALRGTPILTSRFSSEHGPADRGRYRTRISACRQQIIATSGVLSREERTAPNKPLRPQTRIIRCDGKR